MNHLAFRRDTSDEQLSCSFAVEVGSPELLQMLFVFTAADLAAVGPDVWTGWKAEVLTDLYHRDDAAPGRREPEHQPSEYLEGRRQAVRSRLGAARRPGRGSPGRSTRCRSPISTRPRPSRSPPTCGSCPGWPGEVNAQGRYQPETRTVQFTVGTSEDVAPGIFHQLTGALTSQGLEILSAQINTLADRPGARPLLGRTIPISPASRRRSGWSRSTGRWSIRSLIEGQPPTFRRIWTMGGSDGPTARPRPDPGAGRQPHLRTYTIIDIFTVDRRGLLYTITRTLFELGYSVWRAKIGRGVPRRGRPRRWPARRRPAWVAPRPGRSREYD